MAAETTTHDEPVEGPPEERETYEVVHISQRKRPITYWIVLATAVLGGALIAFLMLMGAYVAFVTHQPIYGGVFAAAAVVCFVMPVVIVWWTMEKLLKIPEVYSGD